MTDIFTAVLRMSATATAIAAVLILLRAVMKRVPGLKRKYSYALWAILCVRLLCPVSLSSPVSLFNLLDAVTSDFSGRVMTDTVLPERDILLLNGEGAYNTSPQETIRQDAAINNAFLSDAHNASMPTDESRNGLTVMSVASSVWLVGVAAMALYCVISYMGVKRRVRGARQLHGSVYVCGNIETPFVLGICKPRIYMPENVNEDDYEYILAHERKHISRLDHFIKPLALASLALHWFNPIAWLCFGMMTEDMELSCDEGALESFDRDVKKQYASALLNISVRQNRLAGGMLSFGESNIKSRIKGILKSGKPAAALSIAAVALLAVAAVCLLTNAKTDSGIRYEDVTAKEYSSHYLSGSMWAAPKVYGEPDAEPATDAVALETSAVKTEAASPDGYSDEVKLCTDYLTDYITSQFSGEEAFCAEKYIFDSNMQTFAREANAYDRKIHEDDILHSVVIHAENIKRAEYDGRICLMIPFEVEYIMAYSPLSIYSGYGRAAYFEVESTDRGYRIYRALDFGAANTFATGISEKEAASSEMPFEINIESAVSALLSQKKHNVSLQDFQQIEAGAQRDSIINQFGEPVSSLFGMYGDIYTSGEMRIIVYYDNESKVNNVLFFKSEGKCAEDDTVKQLLHDFLRNGYYRDNMSGDELEKAFLQGSFEYLGRSADFRFCIFDGLIAAPSPISITIAGHTVTSDKHMMPSMMGIYVIGNDGSVSALEDAQLGKKDEMILYSLLPDGLKER